MAEPTLTATLGQALAAHRAGRLTAAEELYRKVLATSPDDARTLHRLGLLLHEMGRDLEGFGYNFQGDKTSFTDQNGSTHGYNYDVLGRLTADIVTAFGSGVNSTVKRLGYSFDTAGRPYQQTSYTNTGGTTVLNQIQDAYNGHGQLITEYQSHVGAVNTSSSPKVQYGYTAGTNFSRLTSVTDPNGRVITYGYNSGSDSTISRLSYLADGSTHLEEYTYLGLSTIVQKNHPQTGIELTYISQSGDPNPPPSSVANGGDRYIGLDAFGRVVDQFWVNPATLSSPTDRFQYAYDRDANVLYRNNIVKNTFSELYHSNGVAENSSYDNLNRITNFARGQLSSSGNNGTMLDQISTSSTSNNWNLDSLGNHMSTATQSHNTFNAQNEITGMTGFTTPTYDNNGNMTKDEGGITYTYDAWNRMASSSASNGEFFTYDADNRRPGLSFCSGEVLNSYYDMAWQDLEDDDVIGSTTTKSTYVWSQSYIDDMLARDQSVNGGAATRIYAQEDANHDVTSITDSSGNVLERFVYDPYGTATVLNATTWASRSDGFSWVYRFQGGRYDPSSGKINFWNRDLNTVTGTWMERDPSGYVEGPNLYEFELDRTVTNVDPSGLDPISVWYDTDPESSILNSFTWNLIEDPNKILKDLASRIKTYDPTGKNGDCVKKLILAGHGGSGDMVLGTIAGKNPTGISITTVFTTNVYKKNPIAGLPELRFLRSIASMLCHDAQVEFATCKSGDGPQGRELLNFLKKFFADQGLNIDVVLHTGLVLIWPTGVHESTGVKTPPALPPYPDDWLESGA